jgi:septal ring factor EnvC (AmiA/AmiB activator)
MQGKSQERSRLTEDRKRLESLIAELQRRAQKAKPTFARSRGKLPWPSAGKLAHRFGEQRSGGLLKWQGIFIGALGRRRWRSASGSRRILRTGCAASVADHH